MSEVSQNMAYEAAFAQLEKILQKLEAGDLPLEESMTLYEQGVALLAYCTQTLDAAELRVRQWQPGNQTTPFEGWQEG
jgi:exodeoxyribonuclease VII small subunit